MDNNSKLYEVLSGILSAQTEMTQILSTKYYNINTINRLFSENNQSPESIMTQQEINDCYKLLGDVELLLNKSSLNEL